MEDPVSVSFIANTSEIGGAERYLLNLAPHLADQDYCIYVPSENIAHELGRNLKVAILPTDGYSIRPSALVKAMRFFRTLDSDVVHFNLANPCASTVDILAARLVNKSAIVLTTHLPTIACTRRERVSDRIALRLADRIITVCESARAYLIGRGVPARKVSAIYNGVCDWQTGRATLDKLRSEISIGPDDIVLGTVARLEEQKGIEYLLEAFQRIHAMPNLILCIVGDGSLMEDLRAQSRNLGIAAQVRFCGWRSDSRDIISLFDVFVLPSLFESFPFTIVEAMMAGKPVVASDVGGVREAVSHGETGLLVLPKDVEMLTEAVASLVESPELRSRMGAAARSVALSKFSDVAMARATTSLYEEIMAERRGGASKMKVLFLSAWFPYPPNNGSRIRAYHLLKSLARRHDVYLISLLQEDSDPANAAHLEKMCKVWSLHESRWFSPGTLKSFLGFFSNRPRSCVDTFDPSVKRAVREAVLEIQPDAVVASTLGVAEYVPHDFGVPCVLDQHNCEYAVLKRGSESRRSALSRFRYALGWKKFAQWEAAVCRSFDAVIMVSERDREQMLIAAPDLKNVQVIANGVDTEYHTPIHRAPNMNTILYNGALTYNPNLEAVRYFGEEIYPHLREKLPNVKLLVTGRTAGVDLRGIDEAHGIVLTGYVEDMRDVLNKSGACIVPLMQGGGSRLKILEAMAAGVPVVSTSMGAEGIECTDGRDILLADTSEGFAGVIERVLTDSELADRLALAARQLVVERYDWKALGGAFVDIVESAVSERRAQ